MTTTDMRERADAIRAGDLEMTRRDGIAYLNGYGEDSHLACFSSHGARTEDCAPVAWRLAYLLARETGEDITFDALHYAMGLVVNDHDDVRAIIREYGHRQYT